MNVFSMPPMVLSTEVRLRLESIIQRIKEILETLDVKNYETTLHVLRIKNGAAKSISDMLGEIYSEGKGSSGQPRSFRKSALERTRGGGVISKIIPDEQTNSLVILANLAGFEQLKQLVAKLDVKTTDSGRIHVYYCEYTKAEDLASQIAKKYNMQTCCYCGRADGCSKRFVK